ncbi:prolyl-tRNA synthetase associated domain-containing protein [Olsenella uli]|uniref:prolyl-tRNA synthetase associated domain-containing protein n=1 Tax=Olsenella uli TaxID=133926 RepID=UPI00195991CD|nr:prolyl-tRNA synthetase associated domain-containing protein [Olsenella uli]MBM6675811.1 prolyl-tRNA synthetase associated domain-containing protein [Olsenella uli]
MYGKVETLELLDRAGIAYELYEHEAVFTVAEAVAAGIPHRELGAKNLFLRDDKHRAYYLVCLPDEKNVPLREIQERLGSRRLSFASEQDLRAMLGLVPGSVTPLGALNDAEGRVEFVLDQALVDAGRLTVHPCDNTATVLLATADLIGLLHGHGHDVRVVDL